jgi:hypothetical protein
MMKVYGPSMDEMIRKEHSNDISNEINRMIQSLTNEK